MRRAETIVQTIGVGVLIAVVALVITIAVQNHHAIQVAGSIVSEPNRTLIPLGAVNATTPATMVHGYKFRINKFSESAGAMIAEERPVHIDADDMIVGKWYTTSGPTFQVKPGEITQLPIMIDNSYCDSADVDICVLYGPDAEHPSELPINGVHVNLNRK